jgi:hypothetical protein
MIRSQLVDDLKELKDLLSARETDVSSHLKQLELSQSQNGKSFSVTLSNGLVSIKVIDPH